MKSRIVQFTQEDRGGQGGGRVGRGGEFPVLTERARD